MEKTIEINTQLGSVVVRKLALGDYAELFRSLKNLPVEFGKFIENNDASKLNDPMTLYAALPEIVATAVPELCSLLAVVTDKDADFISRLDLADTMDILVAALELNDYQRVILSVKKLMALRKPAAAQLPAEQN